MISCNTGVLGSFSARRAGNVALEICDDDGRVVAWVTDPWMAQVIVKLLNENEDLVRHSE